MTDHCIFCDIDPAALIHADDDGTVLISNPVRPGHVLVGANVHGESLHDLDETAAAAVFRLANRTAKALVALTSAEKVYVTAIGDKDKHFHVHLVPKMADDPSMGPHVLGADGWGGALPDSSDQDVERVNRELTSALG